MSQTVEFAAGTRLRCGEYFVELAETADVIFPDATSLDTVADILQSSARFEPAAADNLPLNAAVLNRQEVSDGSHGYPAGTAIDITYGPTGRINTARGLPPVLVP